MLNNQKGFSLFSIIAALVVMGFLATVAVTKMVSTTAQIEAQGAGIAAVTALNSLEAQVYPAWLLDDGGLSNFFTYLRTTYPDYLFASGTPGAAPELGTMYSWDGALTGSSGPWELDIVSGSLDATCVLTRTAGIPIDATQGQWALNGPCTIN